ncbi:hypothetical protein [Glaciibacter sp. 2TAF33]|uniref:hypothetical protein n=1 Tax=Glaciibacter sp. 2TAF33 TaxID=3233015 RepID=UPI003F8F81AE
MRARIAASVVLAAGILLGTSACGFFAPQATAIHYDASDGVSGNVGDIAIRNALLITDNDGAANFIVTVVNQGDKAQSLKVQYKAGGEKVTRSINVQGNASTSVGTDSPTLTFDDFDGAPGSLFPVFLQYGESTGVELLVPVLDGTLAQYATLVPTPEPTPVATITPTPTPTVAP